MASDGPGPGPGSTKRRYGQRAAEEAETDGGVNLWAAAAAEAEADGDSDGGGGGGRGGDGAYVPLKQRRAAEAAARAARLGGGGGGGGGGGAAVSPPVAPVPATAAAKPAAAPPPPPPQQKQSLLVSAARARRDAPAEDPTARILREEQEMLKAITARSALKSVKELATGVEFARLPPSGWKPPARLRLTSGSARAAAAAAALRESNRITVDGEDAPPPVPTFADAKLPPALLAALAAKGIAKPSPIQMQGLPVALSGRDLIGIASTGSGKTLAFGLPLLMAAAQEEVRLPLAGGEGPVGLVIAPSRELARQTHQVLEEFAAAMAGGGGGGGGGASGRGAPALLPLLRCMLCTGGVDSRAQADAVRSDGVHAISATPGRLKDLLTRRRLNLDTCRYLCLDEADRMVDLGFEDDVRAVLSFFRAGRQTVMFSATMPPKIAAFAASALVDPVTVHVGRAGAASLDVIQEVEYVKADARLPYLLDCLQKTAPPVLVFAEGQRDVDDILEFLLLKGVEAVATHGGKDQEERSAAVDAFKAGSADVLVATDVASKGLDFPDVRHVINFDMPAAIEDYTHRIGRTGRGGKTGIATTFINRTAGEAILLDLKRLLEEARQRVPPFLAGLDDPDAELQAAAEAAGVRGCAFCGGLGHRITACPKLDAQNRETQRKQKDWFGSGGFGGEM